MEGSALAEKQHSQIIERKSVGYLMLKGVADYAGEKIDKGEIKKLKSLSLNLSDPDPTNAKPLKAALQKEATRRAFHVALELLRNIQH